MAGLLRDLLCALGAPMQNLLRGREFIFVVCELSWNTHNQCTTSAIDNFARRARKQVKNAVIVTWRERPAFLRRPQSLQTLSKHLTTAAEIRRVLLHELAPETIMEHFQERSLSFLFNRKERQITIAALTLDKSSDRSR
jgi:hypothetical protein